MEYDWQKIFEDKSDKELYRIYKGQSTLPDFTIKIAKDELISRNFDFDKMELNRLSWRLLSLITEEQYSERRTTIGDKSFLSFKTFLLIISAVFLVLFFFLKDKGILKSFAIFSMVAVYMVIIALINNFIYLRIVIKQSKRIEEINRLKNELIEQGQPIEKYPQVENLGHEQKLELAVRKKLILIGIIFLLVTIVLKDHLFVR